MSAPVNSSTSRKQPPWTQPSSPPNPSSLPPLKIYNSLTRSKIPFIPLDPNSKKITWYCCGPTVYDASHLGHARNYVTTDILRRILRDYFGFDVVFVQNVTDVDDKIIIRARSRFLLDEYREKNPEVDAEVVETVQRAWEEYFHEKMKPDETEKRKIDYSNFEEWVKGHREYARLYSVAVEELNRKPGEEPIGDPVLLNETDTKKKTDIKTLLTAGSALARAAKDVEIFYNAVSSVLQPYLDNMERGKGRTFDMSVFTKLSNYWENHFNDDMRRLNVLPPTIITRVSEFIPENIAFVKKLVDKGFAYPVQGGSVYFDIAAFEAAGHHYAKLEPWNRNDASLLAEGEGALSCAPASTTSSESIPNSSNTFAKEKKSSGDFALWKASKAGEPAWESPWGMGRPGWHIECSVMCSHVLGGKVDIHSGGIDLSFPHHDNEIAQSEAYWDGDYELDLTCCSGVGDGGDGKHQWINYFIHMGHLSIAGSKMSKSLKNFVSIREALARGPKGEVPAWTARGLRIIFLMGGWKEGIEIGQGMLVAGKSWEETVSKFFAVVKALVVEEAEKEKTGEFIQQKFGPAEVQLYKDLDDARKSLHEALCDSFNTAAAMQIISHLITKTNIYMSNNRDIFLLSAVKEIARWITRIVGIFGLDSSPYSGDKIGWWTESEDGSEGNVGGKEEIAMPYLRLLSSFRDKVRSLAINNKDIGVKSKDLLQLCDHLRDYDLVDLGVALDDRDSASNETTDGGLKPALIKFVPREELIEARQEKEQKTKEKEAKKEALRKEREEAEKKKLEAGKVSHLDMYKPPNSEEFGEWDDDGIPVKLKNGEEVSKARGKKLKKEWEKQKKLHEAYTKVLGGTR